MKHHVDFISLEENDNDIIISFAIPDNDIIVKSLILYRTFFFEEFLEEEEKGVKVSFEGDHFDKEDFNTLTNIIIKNDEVKIFSSFREYELDISNISKSEIKNMVHLLKKQNYDNRFTIQNA